MFNFYSKIEAEKSMKRSIIISLVILVAGCNSGSGEGLTDQGRPLEEVIVVDDDISDDDSNEDGIQPTLAFIQEQVFTPICSTCHGGASPAAGQNLSSIENSIANLINVDSSNPDFKRVLPGDSLNSYLYLKITGNSLAGSRMPLGGAALPDDMINAIKLWIDQGALVESSIVPATISRISRQVVGKSIGILDFDQAGESSVVYQWKQEGDLNIVFWFNKLMDFTGLTTEQILIKATNHKIQEANSGDLSIDNGWILASENIKLNIINDHMLELNLTQLSSDITRLNIQLSNPAISTLTTRLGQQLDGDNNGTEGGVFNYELFL
jgi:hypothetical protein